MADTSNPYDSAYSGAALKVLTEHFDLGADLYKFWGSPRSVLRALVRGWASADHPSHLHYAWDLETAPSLDHAILETTRRAVASLDLVGVTRPQLFEPPFNARELAPVKVVLERCDDVRKRGRCDF